MNTDRHTLSLHDTLPIAKAGRAGHITFSTARDPDHETCARLLAGLPAAGADLIELGVPFTDPMADGPSIEAANLRALANGATLRRTLDLVRGFRKADDTTPIVLMGYFNPNSAYGVDAFPAHAKDAAVRGTAGRACVRA